MTDGSRIKLNSSVTHCDSYFCFQSPLKAGLPILFVLEPEAVSVSRAFKLVQDYGGEKWTWTVERLQQSSREELQFRDISIIYVCNILEQLMEQKQETLQFTGLLLNFQHAVHF